MSGGLTVIALGAAVLVSGCGIVEWNREYDAARTAWDENRCFQYDDLFNTPAFAEVFGREVEPFPPECAPWLAMRSARSSGGGSFGQRVEFYNVETGQRRVRYLPRGRVVGTGPWAVVSGGEAGANSGYTQTITVVDPVSGLSRRVSVPLSSP